VKGGQKKKGKKTPKKKEGLGRRNSIINIKVSVTMSKGRKKGGATKGLQRPGSPFRAARGKEKGGSKLMNLRRKKKKLQRKKAAYPKKHNGIQEGKTIKKTSTTRL